MKNWDDDEATLMLILREDMGWSNKRIAEFFGTTESAVRSKNFKTRRRGEKPKAKWMSTPRRAKIEFDETGFATIG